MRAEQEQDFVEYVRARMSRLHRIAYFVIGDADRADDAVQTALIALYQRWSRIRAVANLDAYVHTMVVRACLTDRRHWWAKVVLGDKVPETAAHDDGGVEERMVLRSALRKLPERQRMVLVLRFLCDLSVADAAQVLGRSEGTVKTQTMHGLRALREAMAGQRMVPVNRRGLPA